MLLDALTHMAFKEPTSLQPDRSSGALERLPVASPAPWKLRAIGALLFCSVVAAVSISERGVGFAWAENDYLDHMDRLSDWAQQMRELGFSRGLEQLTRPFWEEGRYYNPHPPLFKYLGLLSRELLPFLGFPHAERFPSALIFGGACLALFVALAKARGVAAGLTAALALATFPRLFGYAMFCTPEIALVASWLGAALSHERYEATRSPTWAFLTAALVAAGLSCKISAILVLAPLGLLTLYWRRKGPPREWVTGAAVLVGVAATAILALVFLYPFLWPNPPGRLVELVQQARTWSAQNPFTTLFFGKVVRYPELPWYFALTMVGLTAPPLTLLLALWGAVRAPKDRLWQVAIAQLSFWFLLALIPGTPKYDNERQLLPLFPFLALLAGLGASDLARLLKTRLPSARAWLAGPAVATAAALVLIAGLLGAHPFPLSYYSPAVGGLPGAVRLGFEPTYAMEVLSREVLDDLQPKIPPGSGLTVLPAVALGTFLQGRGWLRPDLKVTPAEGPFFLMVNRHRVLWGLPAQVKKGGKQLGFYKKDGVPLVELWYFRAPDGR